MGVVQLCRPDQRNNPWWIDVVGNFLLQDDDVVSLNFIEKRNAALHGIRSLKRPPHFIVGGRIQRDRRSTGCQWPQDRNAGIPLVDVVLIFVVLLPIGRNGNWNAEQSQARTNRWKAPANAQA